MKDIILCQYGCGQEAKFQTKAGKKICSKSPNQCPVNRKKNSHGGKRAHQKSPEKWVGHKFGGICSKQWRQKNPQWYKISHIQSGKKYSQNQKAGSTKNAWIGKKHTMESRIKMSAKAGQRNNNGYTKYYQIYCPHTNSFVKVQGTWQLRYAEYLNENKVNWIRSKRINLKYRLHQDDYLHTYYPDFYLPDTDQYIEIKGYWWKSKDGKFDDFKKMQKVIEYNNDKRITILTKMQLEQMDIL